MTARWRYRGAALAASFSVLAACSDDGTSPAPPPGGPSAMIAAPDQQLDPSDSYVAMDISYETTTTMSTAQPVYDPYTGSYTTTMTLTSASEYREVEAGYDYYDRVRVNSFRLPDYADLDQSVANEVRTIRSVESSYTQYDANGYAVAAQTPDGAVTTSPISMLGNLYASSITSGVLIEDTGVDPNTPRPMGTAGMEGEVEFPDRRTMRITAPLFGDAGGEIGAQSADAGTPGRGTMVRTYGRQGNKWVLSEVVMESRASTDEAEFVTRQVTRYTNVRWRENPSEDAKRKAARGPRGTAPAAPQTGRRASATGDYAQIQLIEEPVCAYGGGGDPEEIGTLAYPICPDPGDGGGEEPPPPPPPPPGANVVLQHGIFSSGSTWARMDPWLSARYYFNRKEVPSLASTDRLYNQASSLIGRLDATGQNQFILIGHSQGGLISRNVAQRRSDLARGVITIGTPHQGALLARNSRLALNDFLTRQINRLFFGCYSPYQDPGCYIANFLAGYAVNEVVRWGVDAAVPAQIDLQPNNAFVTGLNSTPEYFTRLGIQSHARKRFILSRLGGDAICNPENPYCGGRAWASYTQWAYNGFVGCSILGGLLGYWNQAFWCAYIAGRMDDIDRGWDRLTAPGMTSDGIVQGPSQVYPGANRQYPINNGDSHVGETKSDKTRDQLFVSLDVWFGVPRR